MCDRDRLIELIYCAGRDYDDYVDNQHEMGMSAYEDFDEWLADELLAKGCILPPCKVGDKTYLLLEKTSGGYDIVESKCVAICVNAFDRVYSMAIDCVEIGNTLEFHLNDFGKTVFLTKEEAEERLKKINEMSHIQK